MSFVSLTIAQLSDLHCGSPHFVPDLMERAIAEINDLKPDIVVCSGDLTTFGFKEEYAAAKRYLDRIECEAFVVIPGNHDSRNVGYVHFEELFGERNSVLRRAGATVVAVDSTEPDLDHGQIGRGRYGWIEEQFAAEPSDFRVFVLHHHLLPIPGTGRERNVVYDAGDAIECLQRAGVHLVLSGHKHVPYAWKLENLFVVNTGTVSTLRLRGHTRPCYNVVEVVGIARLDLAAVSLSRSGADHPVRRVDRRVREVHRAHRARGHGETVMRAVALVDGEHYAPVVRDALRALPYEWVGAILVGGTEKLRDGFDIGVPLVDGFGDAEVVVDLSDEPVLGPAERFRWISRALAAGHRRTSAPTSASIRRRSRRSSCRRSPSSARASASGRRPSPHISRGCSRVSTTSLVVAMGRGGPPEPELVEEPPSVADLVARSRAGRHAASDHLEVAALTGVTTIGCRRAGGGLAGAVFVSNVEAGARLAAARRPDVVVFDGSGAAIPPIDVDRRVLVVGRGGEQRRRT